MKNIFVSALFSVMLAAPAFAQSYSPGYGTGNVIDLPALERAGSAAAPASNAFAPANKAFAYEPPRASARLRGTRAESLSPNDPDAVYESGQYVGRDPDPNVRLELRRDWTHD